MWKVLFWKFDRHFFQLLHHRRFAELRGQLQQPYKVPLSIRERAEHVDRGSQTLNPTTSVLGRIQSDVIPDCCDLPQCLVREADLMWHNETGACRMQPERRGCARRRHLPGHGERRLKSQPLPRR